MNSNYYNPVKFTSSVNILTIAMVGGYISWRLMNALYEELYNPLMNSLIPNEECRKHFLKIKGHRVNVGIILKEFVKWLVLVIVLMIIYNIALHKTSNFTQ